MDRIRRAGGWWQKLLLCSIVVSCTTVAIIRYIVIFRSWHNVSHHRTSVGFAVSEFPPDPQFSSPPLTASFIVGRACQQIKTHHSKFERSVPGFIHVFGGTPGTHLVDREL